jgi:hypothetical protein
MSDDQMRYFEDAPTEEDDDAPQEPGPAGVDARELPQHGRTVGEGNAERYFPARTRQEAQASLEGIAAFCSTCPERLRCPEEECAVYRASRTALTVRDGEDGLVAVAGIVLPAGQR